ncbi:hypothetical protein ACP3V3_01935 [Vibrio sp. PNB22_3_1]
MTNTNNRAQFTHYQSFEQTDQKGFHIGFVHNRHTHKICVWADTIEMRNPTIRATLNNHEEQAIICTVDPCDMVKPNLTLTLDGQYAIVIFKRHVMQIKLDLEGITLDIINPKNDYEIIDSLHTLYSELPTLEI